MTIHRFLKKLTPRNMTAFVLANLAMGVTYFISAPENPTRSAYSILEPVLTQNAEASVSCNKHCVGLGCGNFMGMWCIAGAPGGPDCQDGIMGTECP